MYKRKFKEAYSGPDSEKIIKKIVILLKELCLEAEKTSPNDRDAADSIYADIKEVFYQLDKSGVKKNVLRLVRHDLFK